jgi:endoplasmic reticulum Man9GlcNAc2 1,2-alpha-mannosidase
MKIVDAVIKSRHQRPLNRPGLAKFSVKGPSNSRQEAVRNAFKHAWKAYKEFAWGQDELRPISKTSSIWFNLGLTIVDSLDTIYLMDLKKEFAEARDWVAKSLSLDSDRFNNLFEITIRITGGLLSAYHLSGDEVLLQKAYDVGNRSLSAFDTPSSIPLSDINLARRSAKPAHWTSDSSIAEVATLQIELNDLSHAVNDDRFKKAALKVSKSIHSLEKPNGLVPIYISTRSGQFVGHTITLGARGDSYYEYLLKQWIQAGSVLDRNHESYFLLDDWLNAIKGVETVLVRRSVPGNLTFVGEMISDTFSPKMDHLVCFLPGNLALGVMHLKKANYDNQAELDRITRLAVDLTETCYQMYSKMQTGLSPEIVHFNTHQDSSKDFYVKDADRHCLLRPETVESLYYLYKLTGDKKYQDYGWSIFEAFEKYTKIEAGGYTSISDVTNAKDTKPRDKMESFFLAETLKYFYLLFDDADPIDLLHKWIFNTEAHLLPILATKS